MSLSWDQFETLCLQWRLTTLLAKK